MLSDYLVILMVFTIIVSIYFAVSGLVDAALDLLFGPDTD